MIDLNKIVQDHDGVVQMFSSMAEEAYEQAATGVSHLLEIQQQYVAARRERKQATIAAIATILIVAGVFMYSFANANDNNNDSTGPPQQNPP